MWPSWKLPEVTSEILNQLQTEAKESRITINISTEGKKGRNIFVWNEETCILS